MYVNQHIVRPFASLTFLCFDFDYNDFFSVLTQDFSYMTHLDHFCPSFFSQLASIFDLSYFSAKGRGALAIRV